MGTAPDGGQVVAMDMRSELVRMTDDGRRLGTARITNGPQKLRRGLYVAALIQAHGQSPFAGAPGVAGPSAQLGVPARGRADRAAARLGRRPLRARALRWPQVTEAVERLAAAEATVIRGDAQNGIPDHVVMTDPEGNEFCVL